MKSTQIDGRFPIMQLTCVISLEPCFLVNRPVPELSPSGRVSDAALQTYVVHRVQSREISVLNLAPSHGSENQLTHTNNQH